MTPIVNGLQTEFEGATQFIALNAKDGGDGEQAFGMLALPGHPSFVLFRPDGTVVYRSFGVLEAETLRQEIEKEVGR